MPGNSGVSSLWPFSSVMDVAHHLWYMALLIFRAVEAFDQIFHTSLGGTAAYYILMSHCAFEKCLGILFIESLVIGREYLYLSLSLKEHSQSLVQDSNVLLIMIPKEKM